MKQRITCTALICQKTEIEEETGFLSVIKIVSALHVTISPEEQAVLGKIPRTIKTPLDIVLIWDKQPEVQAITDTQTNQKILFDCVVDLIDPNGTVVMEAMPHTVEIPRESEKYYSIFHLSRGVSVAVAGRHVFRIRSLQNEVLETEISYEVPLYINMFDVTGKPLQI